MESKKQWYKWTYLQNKETPREWTSGCWWGEGIVRELGMDMYTLLYYKWITNKDLLYSRWNFAQCYVSAWMLGVFGGEWIHVNIWLNPSAIHLKLSQHCQSTIHQYKIKIFLYSHFWSIVDVQYYISYNDSLFLKIIFIPQLFLMLVTLCSKSLKLGFISLWTKKIPDVQAAFQKGRGTRDQTANIFWIREKAREFQKNIYFWFIDYAKAFVWITTY